MKEYEMIREIFNSCSGNQMRDVFFEEVKTDDPDEFIKHFCVGSDIKVEKNVSSNGVIIYDINTDGMFQRVSLTEI